MKKNYLKTIILTIISAFILASCSNASGGSSNTPSKQEPEIIQEKYIVKNARSEYSVVIPKKYKVKEKIAADNFINYINKSTGARLNVVYDNEVVRGSKYISLGNTSLFSSNFIDVNMDELDNKISSYFISTKDDNIYIYSNPNERGEAVIYGVFDLLHDLIDYEYYASDEVFYNKKDEINLREYKDFFVHPSFDGRAIGNYHLIYDQESNDNLRTINQYRGTEWMTEAYGHSQITTYVRPEDSFDGIRTLHEAHPEWFTNKTATVHDTTNNQLCWSAGEELEEYVAKKLINFFIKYPNATYFMFGQEDNSNSFCRCEKCSRAMANEAVNYAGLQIIFMNHVIEKTEAWLKENQPGRRVRYVVYAYFATKEAPCVLKDGKWVPANSTVVPNENLYIFFAPITCNFGFPLENSYFNSDTYLQLKQWNEVAGGRVIIYFYDINFRHYFANFANFGTVKAMYQACKEFGVSYMYTQGATDTNTSCFSNMREYVESKLMWDLNQSYDDLVRDFIKHYYYEAADEIYEYYQTVRDRLTEYHVEKGDGGSIYTSIANKTIYPYSVLRYFISLFKKAVEKIDFYQESNPDFYQILKARIMREYLSVIYLTITLSKAELDDEEKKEMKDIFETYINYFGISRNLEGATLIDVDALFN